MLYPRDPSDLDPTAFEGYDSARRLMFDHEDCTRTITLMQSTDLFDDLGVASVHVGAGTRADRIQLTGFDVIGRIIDHAVLYIDDPSQQLGICPRFDHAFTRMHVVEGSALAARILADEGWIIDMEALRDYDVVMERRTTERAMFIALAKDMVRGGQLKTLFMGIDGSAEPEAA